MTALFRFFAAAMFLSLLSGCATTLVDYDMPEVELIGLSPLPAQGMEARFAVSLRIINPNTVPLAIEGIHYTISLRDKKVLSGVSAEPVNISAYGQDVVKVEAAVGMLGSLAFLRDLMQSTPEAGLPYSLQTKLSVKGLMRALRIETKGAIELSSKERVQTQT